MTKPAHLVDLARGWSAWTWYWIRGAGFPAGDVLRLASPDAAAAADRLIDSEREVERARQGAIEMLERIAEPLSGPPRRRVGKLIRRLARGDEATSPVPDEAASPVQDEAVAAAEALEALAGAQSQRAQRARDLEAAFAAAEAQTSQALRDTVRDPRFREALLWQNRAGLHGGADRLLEDGKPRKQRRRQRLVASYYQRYCAKNDSIGFFGPVCWGRLRGDLDTSRATPGPGLVDQRDVYFEYWAIDALARQLADDAELRVQLAPRMSPATRLETGALVHWLRGTTSIGPDLEALFRACDGATAARDLRSVVDGDGAPFDSLDEVYALLEQLADRGLVVWTLELPVFARYPERALRRLLEPLDGAARDRGLAALDELEAAGDAVSAAAGDPDRLDAALSELDATFARLAETAAGRSPGVTYGARTIAYEDCRRDLTLELDRDALDGVATALALVCDSARWLTYQIGRRFEAEVEQIVDELGGLEALPLPLGEIYSRAQGLLSEGSPVAAALEAELCERWARILDLDLAARRIQRRSADLQEAVAESFAAPHPGWPGVRHMAPDLLAAARSFDEVARGQALWVLGELHPGNTLIQPVGLRVHPEPGEIVAAYDADRRSPPIQALVPRDLVHRAHMYPPSPGAFDLLIDDTVSARPADHIVGIAELVVDRGPRGLVVRSRDRRVSFGLLEFFSTPLTAAIPRIEPVAGAAHVPRVTVDRLVLSREQWRFSPQQVDFARLGTGPEQFAAARAFAARHGLPRWVFAKVPEEMKPVFVDFDSPVSIDIVAKMARRASSVAISEMIPSVQDAWLPDAEGRTYTCELRMAVVDPQPWRSST